jgi:DNA-directed RNA polymerase specialized sigma24 family protein
VLRHIDDLDGAELAEAAGLPEHDLPQVLEQARQQLRRRLVQSAGALRAARSASRISA